MIDPRLSLANSLVDGASLAKCEMFSVTTYNRTEVGHSGDSAPAISNDILQLMEHGELSLAGKQRPITRRTIYPRLASASRFRKMPGGLSISAFEQIITNSFFASGPDRNRRPYASAGALYSVQAFVHIWNVKGYEPGTYHVLPISCALESVSAAPIDLLDRSVFCQDLKPLSHACFSLFYAAAAVLPIAKYGNAGLRLATMEAGAMYQQAEQCAARFNVRSRVLNSTFHENLCRLHGASPKLLWPLAFQVFGKEA